MLLVVQREIFHITADCTISSTEYVPSSVDQNVSVQCVLTFVLHYTCMHDAHAHTNQTFVFFSPETQLIQLLAYHSILHSVIKKGRIGHRLDSLTSTQTLRKLID